MRDNTFIKSVTIIVFSVCFMECNKLTEIEPPVTSVNQKNVFNSDATAIAAVTNIYASMININSIFNGVTSISLLAGLSSDELTLDASRLSDKKLSAYYKNELFTNSTESYGSEFWGPTGLYYYIFFCNSIIEGLEKSSGLTPAVKKQLMGEAKFIRAFCDFYLVNLFGDVPLVNSTDPVANSKVSRQNKVDVYNNIINDLKDAQTLLSDNFVYSDAVSTTTERTRPSKWAAMALLSRVYLFVGNYSLAEQQATMVINNGNLFSILPLNSVFLKNSKETIWQLQPIRSARNTDDAFLYIIPSTGFSSSNPVYLSSQLLNKFEAGDQRRYGRNWIDSIKIAGVYYYYPYKYKATTTSTNATEYLSILRLSELFLIRAEARVMQNDFQGCIDDVNFIRSKHGGLLNTLPAPASQASAISTIIRERQVELFTEFGQRWIDLKRTGTINDIMSVVTPLKGGTWQVTDQLYPIPFYDIDKNKNLTQNLGYE